jgi:lipopolysaccharide/colanic/teichoic acid biosynthesis glycosyltransferase
VAMAAETIAFAPPTSADAAVSQLSNWSLAGAQAAAEPLSQSAARSRVSFLAPSETYAFAKRTLDIFVAATLLLVLLPLFAIIGLAICLESPGAAFYRGERVGRFARPFSVVKFRSMVAGCDPARHREFVRSLIRGDTQCTVYKVPDDPRITKVGAFLRRTSLDELPQLWNVLRGEMSLVGPRPDVRYAVDEYSDWIRPRLTVKPGLTGLWQVSGRSRLSLLDMYELDVAYARKASLLTDIEILWRTVPAVLGCVGAA